MIQWCCIACIMAHHVLISGLEISFFTNHDSMLSQARDATQKHGVAKSNRHNGKDPRHAPRDESASIAGASHDRSAAPVRLHQRRSRGHGALFRYTFCIAACDNAQTSNGPVGPAESAPCRGTGARNLNEDVVLGGRSRVATSIVHHGDGRQRDPWTEVIVHLIGFWEARSHQN